MKLVRKIKVGDRFGAVVVVEGYVSSDGKNWSHKCLCDCGKNEVLNRRSLLRRLNKPCVHMRQVQISKRYGRLVVIEKLGKSKGWGGDIYKCKCDCGVVCEARSWSLQRGQRQSCGCLLHDSIIKTKVIHSQSDTRLYRIWKSMKNRCTNPKNNRYKYYGAKGVSVCDAWISFEGFMRWAFENGYKGNLTIDRIDNDKSYCPENCQWITLAENSSKSWVERKSRVLHARQLVGQL